MFKLKCQWLQHDTTQQKGTSELLLGNSFPGGLELMANEVARSTPDTVSYETRYKAMRCTSHLECAPLEGVGEPHPPGRLGLLVRSDSAVTLFFGILGDFWMMLQLTDILAFGRSPSTSIFLYINSKEYSEDIGFPWQVI